jgi:hypothetical protein
MDQNSDQDRANRAGANWLTLSAIRSKAPDYRARIYPASLPDTILHQEARLSDVPDGMGSLTTEDAGITDLEIRFPPDLIPYLTIEETADGGLRIKWARAAGGGGGPADG